MRFMITMSLMKMMIIMPGNYQHYIDYDYPGLKSASIKVCLLDSNKQDMLFVSKETVLARRRKILKHRIAIR